jgi:hypothetical protein
LTRHIRGRFGDVIDFPPPSSVEQQAACIVVQNPKEKAARSRPCEK